MTPNIRKRNGSIQDWDSGKIREAICKAQHLEQINDVNLENIITRITEVLSRGNPETVGVEQVEEEVELALMEFEYHHTARNYIQYRAQHAAAPDDSLLSDYIIASKYARQGEEWGDVVDRYCESFDLSENLVVKSMIKEKKILPSMRALQFSPTDKDARYYNCSFGIPDSPQQIGKIFYLLLCGCGVGYSVQHEHVNRLGKIFTRDEARGPSYFVVEDTIEGWAESVENLIYAYMTEGGAPFEFDYRYIRPKGSPISGGFKAPGYLPLKNVHENIRRVLEKAASFGRKLRPIELHDIICFIAEGVLAGGIRRSSLISLFSPDDTEMLNAKTGNWFHTNPQRRMANNSVHLHKNETPSDYVDNMRQFGEPGIFVAKNVDHGTNPCAEIGLHPKGGFAFCNLTEINCSDITEREDFYERCRAAAFLGCIQAGKSDISGSEHNLRDEPLLGVSLTGIMDNLEFMMDHGMLQRGVYEIRQVVKEMGLSHSPRVTTIKPSGTASLVLGNVSAGIHPHHSKKYIRRVIAKDNEPAFMLFKEKNPHMCVKKPDGDWVIEFPCETEGETIDDLTAHHHCRIVRFFQDNWVAPGSNLTPTHNVSCTVVVRDNEWDDVKSFVDEMLISGAMSFLPYTGDKIYPFSPREAVRSETELAKWRALCNNQPVDYSGSGAIDFGSACEGPSCDL